MPRMERGPIQISRYSPKKGRIKLKGKAQVIGKIKEKNINLTLAQVVGSEDQRLWEGFSVMLANAAEKGSFDYERAASYLKRSADRDYLESLLVLSLALYKVFNLKFSWGKDLYVKLAPKKKKEFKVFLERWSKILPGVPTITSVKGIFLI